MSTDVVRIPAQKANPGPVELLGSLALSYDQRSPALARRFVTIAATARGFEEYAETLQLLVSELVTNSVMHARSRANVPIRVRLWVRESSLRLEVHDSDPILPFARAMDPEDERGRGLRIMYAVTSNMGFARNGAGKYCWCELALQNESGAAK